MNGKLYEAMMKVEGYQSGGNYVIIFTTQLIVLNIHLLITIPVEIKTLL